MSEVRSSMLQQPYFKQGYSIANNARKIVFSLGIWYIPSACSVGKYRLCYITKTEIRISHIV